MALRSHVGNRSFGTSGNAPSSTDGVVLTILTHAVFQVELADHTNVLASASETLRRQFVRILPGDRVKMEMPAGSSGRGRIVLRMG